MHLFTQIFLKILYSLHHVSQRFFYPLYLICLKRAIILHLLIHLKSTRHDIIHAQDPLSLQCARVLKYLQGTKLALTVHGFLAAETLIKFKSSSLFLKNFLLAEEKKAYSLADQITCVEARRKKHVLKLINNSRKVISQANFIDGSMFKKKPAKFFDAALPTFRFKILNPKRLIESSDLSTYLDAANRVQQVRNDIAFILTGSGHLKKQIREEIRKRKLKNAFLFDPIPHHVMPVAYNSVDLIVITSRPIGGVTEGISISILEAMASEKPVIASAVGGSLSIISDGQDGYLIPPSDPVTLAEKILELIENKTLRIEMGRNARKKILLKYERDEAIERILMIYQKTLQNTY